MRLIDVDAIERHPRYDAEGFEVGETINGEDIDNAPTVELAVEVGKDGLIIPIIRPVGHWIKNAEPSDFQSPPFICSVCGNPHLFVTPYCEICGAYMRGETDEA